MSDLVGNPEDRFSQNEAHIYIEDIQFFFVENGFYFIDCSGKYLYFIHGKAMNEIYIFFTSQVK